MAYLTWNDLSLLRILGEGQAGVVWLGQLTREVGSLKTGTLLAVKRYKRWILDQPKQYERIVREVQIGRDIRHQNLVSAISLISDPEGLPVLVMRFCDGQTLEAVLEARGNRAPRRVDGGFHTIDIQHVDVATSFEILGGVASALAALHERGLVHRDIKPTNVMITREGPVLMDLGVILSDNLSEATTTASFLGSIRYAAPEHLFNETVDQKADLFSFGAVAYELLLGVKFYGHISHWAELVATRANDALRQFETIDPRQCAELQSLHGRQTAEAIRYTLGRTLSPHKTRELDLQAFADQVRRQFWKHPFYAVKGRLILGEPPVHSLDSWPVCGDEPQQQLSDVSGGVRQSF